MKRFVLLMFLIFFCEVVFAQNEIGTEGKNLVWLLPAIAIIVVILIFSKSGKVKKKTSGKSFFNFRNVSVELAKDALYYPDKLTLTVTNSGNADVDLDRPLLIFDNFWLQRKFRIKGTEGHQFYPLYLAKGEIHTLDIDLNRFYAHDKKLRRYPKVKVEIYNVNGKKMGSRSVFLRKTLLKF